MFLRSKGLVCLAYVNASKRLLSNQIKEVFNSTLDPLSGTNENQLQLAAVSKNLNAYNLDLFVNNLSQYEDRTEDVLNLLANLRATKLANTCLESTHFAVVRYLLENSTIQEIVPVLLDRPKYGIFLNNFTAFAVTQTMHEQKEYALGMPLALKLVLSEEIDSLFVHGFCLKACLEVLKNELSGNQSCEDKALNAPKGKVQEIKVRVKYLRNENDYDVHYEIGKACLKIGSKVIKGNAKENVNILGLVLTKNYSKLSNALETKSITIDGDIADICKKLLSRENQTDFDNRIAKLESKMMFENFIDEFLEEASLKEAASLAEEQKLLLPIWQKHRAQKKSEVLTEVSTKERLKNIEDIKEEINSKRELLWFFDNEDKLDLEIYKKRVFYPKRWFGKKKKPRVVDEHYVPPQIRKIH